MIIKGKGCLKSEDPKIEADGISWVYVCQIDGKLSSEMPQMNGSGIMEKENGPDTI